MLPSGASASADGRAGERAGGRRASERVAGGGRARVGEGSSVSARSGQCLEKEIYISSPFRRCIAYRVLRIDLQQIIACIDRLTNGHKTCWSAMYTILHTSTNSQRITISTLVIDDDKIEKFSKVLSETGLVRCL